MSEKKKPLEQVKQQVKAVMGEMFKALRIDTGSLDDAESKIERIELHKFAREDFQDLFQQFVRLNTLSNEYGKIAERFNKVVKILWNHFGCRRYFQYELREQEGKPYWKEEELVAFITKNGGNPNDFKDRGRSFQKFQQVASPVTLYDPDKLKSVEKKDAEKRQ